MNSQLIAAVDFTIDPIWPWSMPGYGWPALLLVALLLTGLTLWTYLGVSLTDFRRLLVVLGFRLAALLLVVLVMLRPAAAYRDEQNTPSVLILLADHSESMTINDGSGNLSRWEEQRRILDRCRNILDQFRDGQNVTVELLSFAEDVQEYNPKRVADGKRTDFGAALEQLWNRYSDRRFLRGLLILSDGADNGNRFNPLAEAEKWRRRSCPISSFALGQTTAPPKQLDVAVTRITATPSPVPVKTKLTVTAVIDAPGFEKAKVPVRLLIDDKEVAVTEERLIESTGNEVKLTTNAPDKPGEIKVTVKVDGQPNEVIQTNNEITTFVTVSKEGLSVLYVEGRLRAYEPKFIRWALRDPRIRLDVMERLSDGPLTPADAEVFQFDRQHYDVIIIGDISARRLSGGDPAVLSRIRTEVVKFGAGLIMLGGYDTFGGSPASGPSDWKGTPIADLLPVEIGPPDEIKGAVQVVPTKEGLVRYVMKLDDDPKKNQELWGLLRLDDIQRIGRPKAEVGAVVLARANNPTSGDPILVSREVGAGRVLAFAGATTERWRNVGLLDEPPSDIGARLHGRFWKQVALWLARQEEATGNAWVRPDSRRLPALAKQGINVGLRGKSGNDIADAQFTVTVVDPNKTEHSIRLNREAVGHRGVFLKTDVSGEYRIVVHGKGKDSDGQEIIGDATARFMVYQDTAELARQAADHEFLARLANAGGGKPYRADELPRFLQDLQNQPLPAHARAKTELWPDWRRNHLSPFLPLYFVLFVAVLALEWYLRRSWGLV